MTERPLQPPWTSYQNTSGTFFAVEDTVRGILNGSNPLPQNVVLNRETVIGAENFLEKNRRARSEAFNNTTRRSTTYLHQQLEKKAVGSAPFNKQASIISAMRNDCERRQKEATTRADRKSFTLAQVGSYRIIQNSCMPPNIPCRMTSYPT